MPLEIFYVFLDILPFPEPFQCGFDIRFLIREEYGISAILQFFLTFGLVWGYFYDLTHFITLNP